MFQGQRNDLFGFPVLEFENPFRAETDRRDHGITTQRLLIIAVPSHPLGAIVIEIEEAGVEVPGRLPFDPIFHKLQGRCPR
jgi:hypothetical protein